MHKLLPALFFLINFLPASHGQMPYLTEQSKQIITASEISLSNKTFALFPFSADSNYYSKTFPKNDSSIGFLKRKIFYDDFFHLEKGNLKLRIDPAFFLSYGKDNYIDKYPIWENTRGIIVRGKLGKKLYFTSSAYESQQTLPVFLADYVKNRRATIPGMARYRYYKPDTMDCSVAVGELFYKPAENITISLGRGKKFIGYGYRSLFLSYNAPPVPYLSFNWTSKNRKFNYFSYWASTNDIKGGDFLYGDYNYKGFGNINYFSFYPAEWLHIGVVESKWYLNKVDFSYFVPVTYWNSVFDNKHDGSLKAGFVYSATLLKTFMYYGQWEFIKGQLQNGIIATKKINNLFFFARAEYNKVNTGYNITRRQEFFSHLNQFIDYSTENTKDELILQLHASFSRLFFNFKYNEINRLLTNDYPFSLNKTDYYRNFECGIEINPTYRLQIFGRILYFNNEKILSVGLRTNIFGRYTDI